MIRAVAWDIDGTLVDSEPRHHRALLAASRALGVVLDDLEDQAFRGTHMLDVWDILQHRYPQSVTCEGWLGDINRAYAADPETLVPIAGAIDAIRVLAKAPLRQVCVSNSNRVVVDANIAALGIATFLAGSISLDDVTRGKPDPQPYAKACAMLGLAPAEVAAVEDSAPGLAAARAAGLYVIAFGDDVRQAPADRWTGDLAEVPRLIADASR